jgi:GntR family transcriptional repressor for pyruvate dehydrogenase complex
MDWSTVNHVAALSLPDQLSIQLEKWIMNGDLEVGSKLPAERTLAESLGVSRASIRQGLHELEVRGLIDRRPGRGTIVLSAAGESTKAGSSIATALSVEGREITNVMELRAIIEPPIAGLTASRATERDIAQLRNVLDQMTLEMPVATYAALDESFHQAIAQYTHNPLLYMLTKQVATLVAPSRKAHLQTKQRRKNSIAEHENILNAISIHDSAAAVAAATEHVASVNDEIARATSRVIRNPGAHTRSKKLT